MADNENIQYKQLEPKYLEGALEVLRKGFFPNELVCTVYSITKDLEAQKDIEQLCIETAKDGVSIVAIDTKLDKIVGVAFNKIQIKNGDEQEGFFDKFLKNCQNPRSKSVIQLMIDIDATCDLFAICECDGLFEITFLGVLSEYTRKGIGLGICKESIEIARKLLQGVPLNNSWTGEVLNLPTKIQGVIATMSSPYSQKIAKKLQFKIPHVLNLDDWFYNGKTFREIAGDVIEGFELCYLKL